jgi:hypothetical protein
VINQGVASLKYLSQNETMKIGYARVSTEEQTAALQLAAVSASLKGNQFRQFRGSQA